MLLSARKPCIGAEHAECCTLFARKPRAHIGAEIIGDLAERIVVYGEGCLYLVKFFTIKSHGNSSQLEQFLCDGLVQCEAPKRTLVEQTGKY